MGIKIRPVWSNRTLGPTWYDYKMAVVATLIDNELNMRKHGDAIIIFRSGHAFTGPGERVYKETKSVGWKQFYEDILPKIIEVHGS